jgi:uncharacterized protein HemX
MADRIIERSDGSTTERDTETDRGAPTTVVREGGAGVGGALIALVLLVAVAVGGYFLWSNSQNDNLRTRAVADAAGSVGEAAGSVAGAANRAVDNVASPSAPAPAPAPSNQ